MKKKNQKLWSQYCRTINLLVFKQTLNYSMIFFPKCLTMTWPCVFFFRFVFINRLVVVFCQSQTPIVDKTRKPTNKTKQTSTRKKLIVNVHKLQSNTEGLKSALARLRHRTGSPSSPPSTSSPTPNTSSKSVAAAAVAAVLSSASSDNRNVSTSYYIYTYNALFQFIYAYAYKCVQLRLSE